MSSLTIGRTASAGVTTMPFAQPALPPMIHSSDVSPRVPHAERRPRADGGSRSARRSAPARDQKTAGELAVT